MINYLIEFALIHILLFVVYTLLLRKETQLVYLRIYLLSTTLLALLIPLIQLPNYTPISNINITDSLTMLLPELSAGSQQVVEQAWYANLGWQNWLFLSISLLFGLRFIIAMARIFVTYKKSEPVKMYGRKIRHLPELESSFTFFSWIFIDKNGFDNAREIIRHEEAHVKYGHSYDLFLINLLTIPFWWVPSIWLAIHELKQIHEYQADIYTLGSVKYKSYLDTLISHSLKQEGLILTNAFNDTPLTKRLKFMKQLKKNISPWKLGSLIAIISITFYIFSCQTQNLTDVSNYVDSQLEDEIFMIVEEPASFTGGIEAFYKYVGDNLKYPKKALANDVSGRIFIEFVVEKDGRVSNTKLLRGIGFDCDEEALRIVEGSPPWTPAKQKGHIVRTKMVLPITFSLTKTTENKELPDAMRKNKAFTMKEEDGVLHFSTQPKNLATYPGGMEKFGEYLQQNMKYPEEAQKAGIEGMVFIEFKVNTDGSISHAKILKGIDPACDQEAKLLIESSPKWNPHLVDGEAQAVTMIIAIPFVLLEN